jgi:hypothetical protein
VKTKAVIDAVIYSDYLTGALERIKQKLCHLN